ncbi:MAG: hypothetical protein HYU74_12605 [Dechloromonas sp.]|nr:hypothetical protein [Dechloromonas sp.]
MQKHIGSILLVITGLAITSSGFAEPYRCNVNGQAVFQETPCAGRPKPGPSVRDEDKTAAQIQAEFEREKAEAARRKAEGSPLAVPSDASAKYWLMYKDTGKSPIRTIVTRRVGSSGTSWSRRQYNCADYTVRYLGTGDTREQMDKSKPDQKMTNVLPGAIADHIGREACTGFDVSALVAGREAEAEAARYRAADAIAKANSGNDFIHQARAETAVKKKLRDPDSASFRNLQVSWLSGSPIVCGQVNAKNSFGGYVGFCRFVAAGSDVAYLESEMAPGEIEKVWAQFCGFRN